MPELPEVETVVRQLAPALTGQRLHEASLYDPLLGEPDVGSLHGRSVTRVFRLGKLVVVELGARAKPSAGRRARSAGPGDPMWLAVHLRMTGRLIWQPAGEARNETAPRPANLRARLVFDHGCVAFLDTRRFGTLTVHRDLQPIEPRALDPTSPAFTEAALAELLGNTTQNIKAWLLRQDRLVGLGNIYACEILFEAGIDPRRAAGTLTRAEVARLHHCARDVLGRAIDACGTTFSDFQDSHGLTGSYQQYLRVYGREGQPCATCGSHVKRLVQQQRSTFYCPGCQRRTRRAHKQGRGRRR